MKIGVKKGGPLTTIQDLGRYGYQKFGVLVSGAMDVVSLRLANLLVQNQEGEGALELTLSGPALTLPAGVVFALTGSAMEPLLNGHKVPMWRPVFVRKKSLLTFGFSRRGARAYLAVAGGFAVPSVLGSKSTYLRAGLGGYEGRALKDGDVLQLGRVSRSQAAFIGRMERRAKPDDVFVTVPWAIEDEFIFSEDPIRMTKGLQYDWFTPESQKMITEQPYKISLQADRMGYRLEGTPLKLKEARELVSEPVTFGAIQVPADGQPIVLMADHQTTGGYPKIGQVVLADLPRLAQRKPGDSLRFKWVTLTDAETGYARQEAYIAKMAKTIEEALHRH
jgi:antagonist of KipI